MGKTIGYCLKTIGCTRKSDFLYGNLLYSSQVGEDSSKKTKINGEWSFGRRKIFRQVLFHVRAGISNLARSLSDNAIYRDENPHTEACYSCKITKTNNFLPVSVTSMHETDSF